MTDSPHILVVDDDERLRDLISTYLRRNDFLVSRARDAAHARKLLQALSFDMAIIDVMMPGEDGISLCADLHAQLGMPILLLTARGETSDRIAGLEAGADDYLTKPFDPKELLLRINAVLRRTPSDTPPTPARPRHLTLGDLRFDLDSGRLMLDGTPVALTANESQLLAIFAKNPGQALSRAYLVDQLGRGGDPAQDRAIDVQVTRLRRKIEPNPKEPRYLMTVRGQGYALRAD